MANYFNTLSEKQKLEQLSKCRFMDSSEFDEGVNALKNKKIVIIGCGAQGLNQGLNMRDSGLNISYALRNGAIKNKRQSFINASKNGFNTGTFEDLIPTADLVLNLTPDKSFLISVSKFFLLYFIWSVIEDDIIRSKFFKFSIKIIGTGVKFVWA